MKWCLSLRGVMCAAGALLLSGCAQVASNRSLPATLPGATACSTASLENPLRMAPGVGGTGAVALRGPDPGGIGGTGQVATGSGLGGTGSPAQSASPGGGLGGTGIVGVVTGFASICVNGVEVEYDPGTPVQRDGRTEPLSELAVGQLVALQADGQGDRLRAQRIVVLDAAVGPLTAVDEASGRFSVMGQPAVALERADLRGMRVGQWVRVSGLRLVSGEIRATRVARSMPGRAVVTGPFVPDAGTGARVGATSVNLAGVSLPEGLVQGQEVQVSGEWMGGRLRAREILIQPTRTAVGANREVRLQGYVHGVDGREVRLGYDTVVLSDGLQVEGGELTTLEVNQAVQIQGRMDAQQRVTVDRLEFWREGRRGESGRIASPAAPPSSSASDDKGNDDDGDDGDDSKSGSSGSDDSGRGRGRGRGGDSGASSGSSGGDSSGRGRGRGRGGDSGSSGSGSSGSGSSGSGSSGGESSGGGSSTSGGGDSGGDSGRGRGRGRGRGGRD